MHSQIEIRETVPGTVFLLRRTVRTDRIGEDIRRALGEMYTKVKAAGLHPVSPPSVTYLDHVVAGEPLAVDAGVAVAPGTGHAEIGDGARIVGRHARPAARIVHHGDYAGIGVAYQELEEWTARHGYRPAGPPTETYLVGPDVAADPAGYRTEICLPVIPSIGLTVRLDEGVAAAARRTREVLAHHGFSITFEMDMRAMLRERVGVDLEEYLVFGVCAPDLALRTLDTDRQAGLLLPCTVVVREAGDGSVVEALDPTVLVRATGLPGLEPVASDLRKRLDAALASIRGETE
jgi:uncharacterized protein (DUF302 family)